MLGSGWQSPDNARIEETRKDFHFRPKGWRRDMVLLDLAGGDVAPLAAAAPVTNEAIRPESDPHSQIMGLTRESTRRLRRRTFTSLAAGAATILALVVVWRCCAWVDGMTWPRDYSRYPAGDAYRLVMARTPPEGLTGLRVAGRNFMGLKNWVWMRFDLSPAALQKLLAGRERMTAAEAQALYDGYHSKDSRFDHRDKRAVGWHEIRSIQRPEYYWVRDEAKGEPTYWIGVLILDRKHSRGFIWAFGD